MPDSNANRSADANEIPVRPLQTAQDASPQSVEAPAIPLGTTQSMPPIATSSQPDRPMSGEVTQAIQSPQIAVPPDTNSIDADALLADAARRKKVEEDLRKLGMSPDEVRRLLNADSNSTDPLRRPSSPFTQTSSSPSAPHRAVPAATSSSKSRRPAADSLNSFAAQLMSQRSAAQVQAVEQAERSLPAFRDSTLQEARQAEQLLREAVSLRRREKFVEAEAKCRDALALVPRDAAALELLGDLLQGIARIDEALAAYKRAVDSDPKRASAERKLADLLVKQQQWSGPDPEAAPKNPFFAVLLSLLPGLGQFHNGDTAKGLFFLAADGVCYYLIAKSPWGAAGHHIPHRLDIGWIACLTVTAVVYLAASIDAAIIAKQGGARSKSGWDV